MEDLAPAIVAATDAAPAVAATILGFDPKMAGHAVASIPLFAAVFAFVKNQDFVPARFEALLATAVTAGVNALLVLSHGANAGAQIFPTLSASATGALFAMVTHAVVTKKEPAVQAPIAEPEPVVSLPDPVTDANLALTAAKPAQPILQSQPVAKRSTVRARTKRPKKTRRKK